MGTRILHDARADEACLYCSTTEWAFGPMFNANGEHGADERAEAFLRWFDNEPCDAAWSFGKKDVRNLIEPELQRAYAAWLAQEQEQYAREELERQIDGAESTLEDR